MKGGGGQRHHNAGKHLAVRKSEAGSGEKGEKQALQENGEWEKHGK